MTLSRHGLPLYTLHVLESKTLGPGFLPVTKSLPCIRHSLPSFAAASLRRLSHCLRSPRIPASCGAASVRLLASIPGHLRPWHPARQTNRNPYPLSPSAFFDIRAASPIPFGVMSISRSDNPSSRRHLHHRFRRITFSREDLDHLAKQFLCAAVLAVRQVQLRGQRCQRPRPPIRNARSDIAA